MKHIIGQSVTHPKIPAALSQRNRKEGLVIASDETSTAVQTYGQHGPRLMVLPTAEVEPTKGDS